MLSRLSKLLLFGISAAIGCLILALFGEIFLALALPSTPTQSVDIMFVLDRTNSMTSEIEGVKNGINEFVSYLSSQKLDTQVGLIAFGDRVVGETEPIVLSVNGGVFTKDANSFRDQLSPITTVDGVDHPESSLDALVLASGQPFRSNATKVIILITDAAPKIPDKETSSIDQVVNQIRQKNINQLHLVIQNEDQSIYSQLQVAAPGQIFSLADTAEGRQGFDKILPEVGKQIANAIGTGKVSSDNARLLIAITSIWTAMLAIGIFLALIIAQNRYLRRRVLTVKESSFGITGSVIAGLGAGAAGQLFYGVLPDIAILELIGRVIAWTLLGGLLGWGIGFFIPNINRTRSLMGGSMGGVIGGIGFLVISNLYGDIVARLLGATIVGFFIGLAIAIIQDIAKEAWLIVHWSPREKSEIALGAEAIILGSSQESHIYWRDLPSFAGTISLDQGVIKYFDKTTNNTQVLTDGSKLQISGAIWIEVKTKK